jgi:4-amino-4-deoxy-L-arabinose transferase-like glycosyltransferase
MIEVIESLGRGIRPYVLLSVLCALLFGPGLAGMPPLDRDESRFMQATRQMLETGDYIRIRFQDEMRAKKPAGAYWLQAAAVRALSHPLSTQAWPYRLPGALACWAAVLMTFAFGRGVMGTRPALLGALLLAVAAMVVSEAHQAKSDAIMLACMVAAQGALGRIYIAARTLKISQSIGRPGNLEQGRAAPPDIAEALTFWLAMGVGVLIKGPIVPVISLLTILALSIADRSWAWLIRLRPITGFILATAIAAPWFVAISHATQGAFVGAAVKGDLLPKLLGAQESHGGWPGMYAALSVALLWPGSLLILPAVVSAWGQRHRLTYRFLLAWAIPAWVMFELVPTKLPHYVLPVFPALALLTGAGLSEGADVFFSRWTKLFGSTVWVLVGLALAALAILAPVKFGAGFMLSTVPIAVSIVLATVLAAVLLVLNRPISALAAVVLLAVATWPPLLGQVGPRLDRLWVSRAVATEIDLLAVTGPVAVAGYAEPSLVFLLGTKTLLTDGPGAARHLAEHPEGAAVVALPDQAAFLDAARGLGMSPDAMDEIQGLNYSKGKPVTLEVYVGAAHSAGRKP